MSPGSAAPGLQPLDHVGVAAGRHEADVLAVVLVGDREAEAARQLARLRLGPVAERKAQEVELLAGGGEQEIALVALVVAGAVERARRRPAAAATRRNGRSPAPWRRARARSTSRSRNLIDMVAVDARHRRLARDIALGEAVDHRLLEAALVVEHVMRECRCARRPRGRRGCPGRRSRRPCDGSPRRGRKAAA